MYCKCVLLIIIKKQNSVFLLYLKYSMGFCNACGSKLDNSSVERFCDECVKVIKTSSLKAPLMAEHIIPTAVKVIKTSVMAENSLKTPLMAEHIIPTAVIITNTVALPVKNASIIINNNIHNPGWASFSHKAEHKCRSNGCMKELVYKEKLKGICYTCEQIEINRLIPVALRNGKNIKSSVSSSSKNSLKIPLTADNVIINVPSSRVIIL